MAALTAQQRTDAHADWQRTFASAETIAVERADVKAAFDAMDDWLDLNETTLNLAIPLPARTNLTAAQKRRLFLWVVRKRYETGT